VLSHCCLCLAFVNVCRFDVQQVSNASLRVMPIYALVAGIDTPDLIALRTASAFARASSRLTSGKLPSPLSPALAFRGHAQDPERGTGITYSQL
jgi:hypothetical protein